MPSRRSSTFLQMEGLKNGSLDESVRTGQRAGRLQAHCSSGGFCGSGQLRSEREIWWERNQTTQDISSSGHLASSYCPYFWHTHYQSFIYSSVYLFIQEIFMSTFVTVTASHKPFCLIFNVLFCLTLLATKLTCSVLITLEGCLFFQSKYCSLLEPNSMTLMAVFGYNGRHVGFRE